jgi:TetR/AcrR family tetracycline transcriptional repressor
MTTTRSARAQPTSKASAKPSAKPRGIVAVNGAPSPTTALTAATKRKAKTKTKTKTPARKGTTAKPSLDVRRVGLSTELIVDTACELIAESHTDQLTMRRLSERLGVALGATYHYVPDRDSLLVMVAHRINASISLRSTRRADWASTLRTLMVDYADAYARYPGMSNFANSHLGATGPDQTQLGLLKLLHDAGFEQESAFNVLAAFFFYTSGATASGFMHTDQPGYPSSHLIRRFENGLDLLIEGTKAQLRSDKKAARAR